MAVRQPVRPVQALSGVEGKAGRLELSCEAEWLLTTDYTDEYRIKNPRSSAFIRFGSVESVVKILRLVHGNDMNGPDRV